MMINKFKYILSISIIGFIFCKSVFAVQVYLIPENRESAPEYQSLIERCNDVDTIAKEIIEEDEDSKPKTVLKVWFDDKILREEPFLSGQSTYPIGEIYPPGVFQQDEKS